MVLESPRYQALPAGISRGQVRLRLRLFLLSKSLHSRLLGKRLAGIADPRNPESFLEERPR